MTKKDMAKAIAEAAGITQAQASGSGCQKHVQALLAARWSVLAEAGFLVKVVVFLRMVSLVCRTR
jgi:hypothetical protein